MTADTEDTASEAVLRDRHFQTTHWSIVLAAGRGSSPNSSEALATLCQTYWYPLYAYVRRRVSDAHEAQDLTQGFFTQLLEKNYVAAAESERGKFRAFLLTSLLCCRYPHREAVGQCEGAFAHRKSSRVWAR